MPRRVEEAAATDLARGEGYAGGSEGIGGASACPGRSGPDHLFCPPLFAGLSVKMHQGPVSKRAGDTMEKSM